MSEWDLVEHCCRFGIGRVRADGRKWWDNQPEYARELWRREITAVLLFLDQMDLLHGVMVLDKDVEPVRCPSSS